MRGETRRKARRRHPGDEALRRVSPRRRRERRCRERERGRAPEHRAELPRVPCAACFAAASGAEPAKMRRVAQDCDPKTYMYMSSGRKDGEAARSERRARLPETKPHIDRQTSTAQAKLASPKPKHAPPRPRHRYQVAYFATLSTRSATFEAASGVARARIFADISARRSGRS